MGTKSGAAAMKAMLGGGGMGGTLLGGGMPSAEQLSQLQQQMQKPGMPGGGGFNPLGKGDGLPGLGGPSRKK